jgi:hypothetical protein
MSRTRDEDYVKVAQLVIYLTDTMYILTTILAFFARQYWPLLAFTGLSSCPPFLHRVFDTARTREGW